MIRSALKRRVRPKMGVRTDTHIRSHAHLKFVRGNWCCIVGREDHVCSGRIEAMHVRMGTDGALAIKPSDCWTIPGCNAAHREQHQIGEPAFEKKYGIHMKNLAAQLWQISPAGKRYRAEKDGEKR